MKWRLEVSPNPILKSRADKSLMAQLFSPRANTHSRVILAAIVLSVGAAGWATSEIFWSPYTTYVGIPFRQRDELL